MTALRSDDPTPLESAARELACRMLDGNPERTRHSAAVAARAATLSATVAEHEASVLVAAAWLHDIGYSPAVKDTGFHPLDGARFLRSLGWDPLLCDLVAHHSGSRFVAAVSGLDRELAEFTFNVDPVSDALTIADQTIGPHGRAMTLDERMRDMLERHGPDSPNAWAHSRRKAYFQLAWQRVALQVRGNDLADAGTAVPPTSSRVSSQRQPLR